MVPGSYATYKRNPDYWNTDVKNPGYQLPYVDKIKALFLTDVATELAAFRTGKIDQLYGSGMSRHHVDDLLSTNPDTGVAKFITGNSYWSLRQDIEPFNKLDVRKAMNMAINRQEILEDFYDGEGSAWNEPYPPVYSEVYMPFDTLPDDIKEIYEYNPEGAKKLLADAGYPDGFKTQIHYYAAAGSDLHEKNALIASYLADIGIEVEVNLVDYATNRSMRYGFSYPAIYGDGMGVNYPEHFYSVWTASDAPWNRNRINDAWVDEQIETALQTFDVEARRAIYREIDYKYLRNCYMGIAPVNGYTYTVWQPWMKSYAGQRCLVFLGSGTVYARVWIDQDMRGY
jgi:peptide/nickel transport system substrate-binding protein